VGGVSSFPQSLNEQHSRHHPSRCDVNGVPSCQRCTLHNDNFEIIRDATLVAIDSQEQCRFRLTTFSCAAAASRMQPPDVFDALKGGEDDQR
jgi:hypothetical protein